VRRSDGRGPCMQTQRKVLNLRPRQPSPHTQWIHPRTSTSVTCLGVYTAPYPRRGEFRPDACFGCMHQPSLGICCSCAEIVGTSTHWVSTQSSCHPVGICAPSRKKGAPPKLAHPPPPYHTTSRTSGSLLRKVRISGNRIAENSVGLSVLSIRLLCEH